MLTLFTGMPGAGKTAAMVDLLRKEVGDRPVWVDGVDGFKLPHSTVDASTWHEQVPDGAIVVIDEVQRLWRARSPGSKVPDAVQALEVHRHRGIDVYMTTQHPRLLDANVRGLIGRHVHIRDTGFLGRWWYEWPECNEGTSWKTCPNKRRYKLPRAAFELYKSASLHVKPKRGVPPMAVIAVGLVLATVVLGGLVLRLIGRHVEPEHAAAAAPASSGSTSSSISSQAAAKPEGPPIDDRVDWVPRISGKPETAKAYDRLRVVQAMPRIAGGLVAGRRVVCYSQQGTVLDVPEADCRAWIERRPFDPYLAPPVPLDAARPVVHAAAAG